MSLEQIQQEVAGWPDDMVRRLQAYLVTLHHQRSGRLEKLSAKLDDPSPERWVGLDELEKKLNLNEPGV